MPIVIDGKTFETFTEAVNHVKKTKPRLISPEKYVSRIQKKQRNAQLTAIKIRISRIVGRPKTQRDRLNEANSYAKEIGKRIGRGEEHIPNVQDELAGLTKYVTDGTKIRPPKPTQKDRKKIISAKQKTAVSALSSVGNTTSNLRKFSVDKKFEDNVKHIVIRDMDSIRQFLLRKGTLNSFVLGDLFARKIGNPNEYPAETVTTNHGGYLPINETNLTYGNGVIVKMHPQKFLDLATELGTHKDEKSYQNIMEGYKKGRPMGILSFEVDGTNQIISHEGRHRATAARDFGLKEIPVLIERSKNRYPPFTDEEAAALKTLKPLKSERLYGYQKNAGINLPDDYEKREKRYDERNKKIKNPKKFDWKKHEVQGFRQKTDELMSALTEDKLKRVRSSPLLEDQTMRIEHGDELTGRGLISEEEAIKGARIECPKTNLAKLKNRLVERNLAKLKTRMDEIKTAKEHKHTIQFRQAKRMGEVGEFRGATQGKYWKYWLLNAKQTNGNGWGVSSDSIDSNIAKFIGRPFCVTAKQWFPESEYETYEHPYLPTNNLDVIFNHQAKYSVGEIVDVMKNDDGDYYAMIRPHSKFANHSPPAFCSPAIFQLDPSEPENKISKWEALHLAGLDRDPAYGAQIALLKGTCVGTVNECKVQFKSAKQEKYDSDYIDAKRFAAYKLNAPAEVRINPEHGEKIANAYEQMKHEPNNPNVKAAYGALIDETGKQFKDLIGDGLKITKLKPNEPNPYSTSKHMHEDIEKNNHIYYFPTESGFGQGENNPDHPMLQPTEFKDADQPLLANDVFRIVHDVNGHYVGGKTTFGPKGEHQAYLQHSRMYSPLAKKALFTETVGQNNWVNFGPYGTKNRSDPKNTVFAEQKAGLLPDEIVNGRFHI